MRVRPQPAAAGALAGLAAPAPAWAHAFGERYDLPLPLWLYLSGAAAAVALTFAVMALFAGRAPGAHGHPQLELSRWAWGRALAHPATLFLLRLAGLGVFLLVVVAGFIGVQDPFENVVPVLVWVLWWVGFSYVAALIGDLWVVVNPFETLYRWGAAALGRGRASPDAAAPKRALPQWLGLWPAFALFAAFAWTEIAWHGGERPAAIAGFALAYAALTCAGMALFGVREWLATGEAFAVIFGVLGRFAPLRLDRGSAPRWVLRPYAVGLLVGAPVHPSLQAFVLLMLTAVTFDGFTETPAWAGAVNWALSDSPLIPAVIWLDARGVDLGPVLATLGMAACFLLFVAVYRGFAWLMARAAGGAASAAQAAGWFVLTLVPIAIAYHLAHYLSFLLTAGQYIIPLASDPFGFGWDLFGTRNYFLSIAIVDARFVWLLSVAAIVIGHIVAVYLAHVTALRAFADARRAQRSQYPMLALMLGYTMTSLWILAQPIVQ